MVTAQWQTAATIVTVVAAVVAIVTLLLGLASFRQATEAQKDAASTTMLQEYLKLRADAIGGDHEEPYLYFLRDGTGTNQYVEAVTRRRRLSSLHHLGHNP